VNTWISVKAWYCSLSLYPENSPKGSGLLEVETGSALTLILKFLVDLTVPVLSISSHYIGTIASKFPDGKPGSVAKSHLLIPYLTWDTASRIITSLKVLLIA